MHVNDFVLLVEMVQPGKMVAFFHCPVCGAAVGELAGSEASRNIHIMWHVMGK